HTHRLSPIPHAFQVSMSVLTHTTATTETSTLSLHDALPIYIGGALMAGLAGGDRRRHRRMAGDRERRSGQARRTELEAARIDVRSEEHTSELQSRFDLVCRLLLEKKNTGCATGFISTCKRWV